MSPLGFAIIRTVAYFDILGHPLTALEIWRWLYRERAAFGDVTAALEQDQELQNRLATTDGFWFIRGSEDLPFVRLRRARIAERKFRRARRAVAFLRRVPGVLLIAVANTLSLAASREEGDIDLFIVAAPGTVWSVRAAVVAILAAAHARPEERTRDALCPSFFVTDDALDLSPLRIPDDVYLPYWVATLLPLASRGDAYRRLWHANQWVRDTLPNAWPRFSAARQGSTTSSVAAFLEQPLRCFQEKKFSEAIRVMKNKDTRVVTNDCVLKFHTNDRRAQIRDQWLAKCSALGV